MRDVIEYWVLLLEIRVREREYRERYRRLRERMFTWAIREEQKELHTVHEGESN